MKIFRGALASLALALVFVGSYGVPAAAQVPPPPRPILVVGVSDSPDPAASAGPVTYAITVKNDGTTKARKVLVTTQIPAGTEFVSCTALLDQATSATACAPGLANGTVTVFLGLIRAHQEPRITLRLRMPSVSVVTLVTVEAKANGDNVTDSDWVDETTTILPATAIGVTFLPSGRVGSIACGMTLSPDVFGTDTTVRLSEGLGCTSEPYGLKITASGKTIDLNMFKIVGTAALGNVGILVSAANDVTIIGGSIGGSSGIEQFDWCVKDEGKSLRLAVMTLRCFRARTAGIDIKTRGASITNVLVDRAIGTATTTAEMPGGVGIRTRGEALIKDSIVRQAGAIGIWVAGATDVNGDGRIASIQGDKASCSTTTGSKMLIEKGVGIGLLLDDGPHFVKNVCVKNLYNDREDTPIEGDNGVVVGLTGLNNFLEGVVVKQYGGNAFVVHGTGTTITDSSVDLVGLDGFVVTGAGTTLSGNGVQKAGHGFIVTATALDTDLNTNETEDLDGDGFVVDGDVSVLTNNTAQGNAGRGFVIGGDSGLLDTNTAEDNNADGFIVTGNGHTLKTNNSKNNGGTGYTVSGSANVLNSNSAEVNDGSEWVIGINNSNGGGNTRGSGFPAISFTSAAAYTSPN